MIPIWYLDIDGVVNIVGHRPDDVPEEHWREGRALGLPIRWDTRVVDFINEAARSGRAEIRWLTTWEQLAIDEFAPLVGLDAFTCPEHTMRNVRHRDLPPDPQRPASVWWWKFESVLHHTEADRLAERDIIWTDDDLLYAERIDPRIRAWARARKADLGRHTLAISPRTGRGLTPEMLQRIDQALTVMTRASQ